jgi:hypothetical protein
VSRFATEKRLTKLPDSIIYYLVSLLVTSMFKLKDDLYLHQNVSIEEFTFLVTGILSFDDWLQYTIDDIEYCLFFLNNNMHNEYIFLTRSEVLVSKKSSAFKSALPHEENIKELNKKNEAKKADYCPKIIEKLQLFSKEDKENIMDFYILIHNAQDSNYNNFPTKGVKCKSLINDSKYAYSIKSLFDWLKNNFELNNNYKLPLTYWAKEVLIPTQNILSKEPMNSLIDINSLPKPLKLAVAAYLNIDWEKTDTTTEVGTNAFKKTTEKFLIEKAKNWEVYLNYEKGKHIVGIGKENIKIITRWIKPPKL